MYTKTNSARVWALDILLKWEEEAAYSNFLLHQQLQKSKLEERDKRLVTELVYGTIQRLHTLDVVIGRLVKKGKLDNWVKQLLRLSLYQLLYLDKIPERATVHEAVEIAKWRGNIGVGKFVNGVLRSFLRHRKEFTPLVQPKTTEERAFAYSFPEWIVEHLTEAYGTATADQVMQACNQVPKVSIRVNTMRASRDAFLARWHKEQSLSAYPSELSSDGVILSGVGNAANHPWYQTGDYSIQDESSMLVTELLDPKPGMRILDACAAPGGKTTHLAERMGNQGSITAFDIHPHKVKLIEANARRLGISIIESKAIDARNMKEEEQFDAVLLDAPCSGLGVIMRKPDIKWRKTAKEIDQLSSLQQELLDELAQKVKSGGVLVYSTCTWEPMENELQVANFLERHPDFRPDLDFLARLPKQVQNVAIIGKGWVQLLPHHFHSDGFFIARLIKQ
jgi:16S rRNA (cytosine967-C5)-methyltransferase